MANLSLEVRLLLLAENSGDQWRRPCYQLSSKLVEMWQAKGAGALENTVVDCQNDIEKSGVDRYGSRASLNSSFQVSIAAAPYSLGGKFKMYRFPSTFCLGRDQSFLTLRQPLM